jgi:hypothetical protein
VGPTDAPGGDADAGGEGPADCGVGDAGEPLELRCAGLYSDFASKTVAPGVVPYDPGLHLWSDGADKSRWISLPAGQTIDTSNMDEWVFPVGTRLYKEFVLGGVRIETRMLWKRGPQNWYPTTYRWSADGQSSATELLTGELDVTDAGYEVPSQARCVKCHSGRRDFVLGFEAVSLSTPAATGLTMSALVAQSRLTKPPSAPLTIPGTAVEQAALGYLHANCGETCHNANSDAAALYTGLFLRLEVGSLASVAATNAYKTSWNVATQLYMGAPKRVAPCDIASSCIYVRPSQRDGLQDARAGTQMPPVDTHAVDAVGISAIAAWINEGCVSDAGVSDAGVSDAGVSDAGADR